MILGAVLGVGVALGVLTVIWGLSPRVRTEPLAAALADFESGPKLGAGDVKRSGWRRFVDGLLSNGGDEALKGVDADILVCGYTSTSFVAAVFGRSLLLLIVVVAAGVGSPYVSGPVVPTGFVAAGGIVAGVVGAASVWRDTKQRAVGRRQEFSRALLSMTDFVRLGLTFRPVAGSVTTALATGSGWPFEAMRVGVDDAARFGEPVQEGLRRVGIELAIPELVEFANAVDRSSQRGSNLTEILEASSSTMRDRLLSKEMAEAGSLTAKTEAPIAVLTLLLMVFVMFPAINAFGG